MFNNLKNNIKNKTWWIAVISLLILIGQSHGIILTKYIGVDWQVTLTNIFTLLTLVGISVDTTNTTKNTITTQEDNKTNEVQTEATTTSINNEVSENSVNTATLNDTKIEQIKTIINQ